MTDPDRLALNAAQTAWAHSQQAPLYVPAALPVHENEIMAEHLGTPAKQTFSVEGEALRP
jgi:hypothetical protein